MLLKEDLLIMQLKADTAACKLHDDMSTLQCSSSQIDFS